MFFIYNIYVWVKHFIHKLYPLKKEEEKLNIDVLQLVFIFSPLLLLNWIKQTIHQWYKMYSSCTFPANR